MNSNIESFGARWAAASVLGLLTTASHADGGHSVPAGVSAQQHVHLFDQVVVSPSWLMVAGLAALAVAALVVKRRRIRTKAR